MEYHRIGGANPETIVDNKLEKQPDATGLLAVEYELTPFWRDNPKPVALVAVYEPGDAGSDLGFLVQEANSATLETIQNHRGNLQSLAEQLDCDSYVSNRPVALQPVHIPKPWGEEIWYTGMEERGVAAAGWSENAVPLPWVLSALPERLCHCREHALILLKILAPLPDEVYGDLYFELHQEKREVYVITHIDEQAWPSGVGAIRFGFCEQKRTGFDSDEAFKAAFIEAVRDYEAVRRQIDALLDQQRQQEGIAPDAPVPAELTKRWMSAIPEALRDEETQRRRAMDSFSALLPLRVGDVVKVPTLTPHSLQHGVRAVEFQTPVYERLIVSFAQKVLTQKHWDTDAAAQLMQLDTPPQQPSEVLREGEGYRVERIVDFQDFEVCRYLLKPGAQIDLTMDADYGVLMAIKGTLILSGSSLTAEQSALLPASWSGEVLSNSTQDELIFLVAYPQLAR